MKPHVFFFLLAFPVIAFFSCASLTRVTPVERSGGQDGEVVELSKRPETSMPTDQRTAPDLRLPEITVTRAEIRRQLAGVSTRAAGACERSAQSVVRAVAVKKKKPNKAPITDPVVVKKEKVEPSTVPEVRKAPVSPKNDPVVAEPTVKPVVTTPVPENLTNQDRINDRVRTVYARKDDDIEISFKENGWLLLEMPGRESGLDFVSRTIEDGKTIFKFHGRQLGTFALPFQYQDHLRGIMRREIIEIKVVPEPEFNSIMGSRETESESARKAANRENAARLHELGKYADALREYLTAYSEGDPALNETIATLAFIQQDYPNAVTYWKKNLKEQSAFRDKAVIGLVKALTAEDDRQTLLIFIRELLKVKNFPIEDELVALIRYFTAKKEDSLVQDLLSEYLSRYPYGLHLAEIYYRLGDLHEQSPGIRDFKKARDYYMLVVRNYPESWFFLSSKKRIDYINRHYFHVR